MTERRVLSIQSHVVVGHVGNRSAVFPLQLLGHEVDILNTVQFSNHTGYGKFAGMRMDADHINSVFAAMEENGLVRHTHLLTGYTPGAEALQAVSHIADRLRQVNPDLVYVLDTVCGDQGKLYVSPEVIPIYKELLTKATVSTPNQFEAELFSGVKITSLATVQQALFAFHQLYNLPHVVISSLSLPKSELQGFHLPEGAEDVLVCAGSSFGPSAKKPTSFIIVFPEYHERFEGVGDVFSALVLAHFDPRDLAGCTERAIASLSGIIRNTRDHAYATLPKDQPLRLVPGPDESDADRVNRARHMELRLIQSQDHILHAKPLYHAQPLP